MAAMTKRSDNPRLPDNLARFRQDVEGSDNPYLRLADGIARLRMNAEGPFTAPELSCHRTREHAPHVEYADPGAPFDCPGVGDFTQVIDPPTDPFAGIPADEEF